MPGTGLRKMKNGFGKVETFVSQKTVVKKMLAAGAGGAAAGGVLGYKKGKKDGEKSKGHKKKASETNKYLEKLAATYLGNPKKFADTFSRRALKNSSAWKKFKINHGEFLDIPGVRGGLEGRTERAYGRLKMRDSRKKHPIMTGLLDLAGQVLFGTGNSTKSY